MQPTLSYLNDVYFGVGVSRQLPAVLERYGIRRPLVVTDRHLASIGVTDRVGLGESTVFADVETNPTEQAVRAAVMGYTEETCDGFVAIGGGSPIDLAKGAALAVSHEGQLSDYAVLEGGPSRIDRPVPPVLAVPTTAGTGSEVGRAALLTVADGRKLGFLSPKLLPVAAVCDPDLTATMPASLSAATGMDAISHCVEAILSPRENPVAEAVAVEGLRRGSRAIKGVTEQDVGLVIRAEMMWCSLLGGLAFQKGLGAVHSLSHPLGRLAGKRLHHGTLNALFLPAVLRYNAAANPTGTRTVSDAVGGVDPAAFFEDLLDSLGLPTRLADLGVTDDDLVSSAPLAAADHCTPTNPRSLSEADALALYRSCL